MACGTPVVATAVGGVREIVASWPLRGKCVTDRSEESFAQRSGECWVGARSARLSGLIRRSSHGIRSCGTITRSTGRQWHWHRAVDPWPARFAISLLRSDALMCGIYGIYQRDGTPADVRLLARMGDVIIHRGPDDSGSMADGPCAIGMRRLSIIDLAGGHQPIRTADGQLAIVCNGEIYNYRELRAELIAAGRVFATQFRQRSSAAGLRALGRSGSRIGSTACTAMPSGTRATARCSSVATASASSRCITWTTAAASRSRPKPRRCWSCRASAGRSIPRPCAATSSWVTFRRRFPCSAASASCRSAACCAWTSRGIVGTQHLDTARQRSTAA